MCDSLAMRAVYDESFLYRSFRECPCAAKTLSSSRPSCSRTSYLPPPPSLTTVEASHLRAWIYLIIYSSAALDYAMRRSTVFEVSDLLAGHDHQMTYSRFDLVIRYNHSSYRLQLLILSFTRLHKLRAMGGLPSTLILISPTLTAPRWITLSVFPPLLRLR